MSYQEAALLTMEMMGTIAFALSGAMKGVQKHMDILGVVVLGLTTAGGGGVIRDLLIGVTPPMLFRDYRYALVAILSSLLLFLNLYMREKHERGMTRLIHYLKLDSDGVEMLYDQLLMLSDTVGLGIFSVMGAYAAIKAGYGENLFLVIFVGVMTGVGGGAIRDMLSGDIPFILTKHIYALASLIGTIVYLWLQSSFDNIDSMVLGAVVIVAIRYAAAIYQWNLPKIG